MFSLSTSSPSEHTPMPSRRPTILLVDDSPDNLLILGDILVDAGYEVVYAEDGVSGLERANFVKPNLIIMDVRMPRMDGLTACRILKEQVDFLDVPIILMSSQQGGTLRKDVLDAGSMDFWEKPICPSFLRKTLNTILPFPKEN